MPSRWDPDARRTAIEHDSPSAAVSTWRRHGRATAVAATRGFCPVDRNAARPLQCGDFTCCDCRLESPESEKTRVTAPKRLPSYVSFRIESGSSLLVQRSHTGQAAGFEQQPSLQPTNPAEPVILEMLARTARSPKLTC